MYAKFTSWMNKALRRLVNSHLKESEVLNFYH